MHVLTFETFAGADITVTSKKHTKHFLEVFSNIFYQALCVLPGNEAIKVPGYSVIFTLKFRFSPPKTSQLDPMTF